jgi:hypothetical protein
MSKSSRKKQTPVMSDIIPTSFDESNIDAELDAQAPIESETYQEPQTEVEPEVISEPEVITEADEAPADEPTAAIEPEQAPAVEVVKAAAPAPTLTKDVLRAVFNKRIVRYVDDALWATAVQAVKEGNAVTCTLRPPYLTVTQVKFDPAVKTKGAGSLNAIIAGMI